MQLKSEVEKGLDEFSNRIWIQLEKLVKSKFKTELSDDKTKLKNIKEIVLTKLRKKFVNPELNQLFFVYCKGQDRVIQNGVAERISNLIIENWTDLGDIKVHRLDIQDGFNSCQNLIKPTRTEVIPTMVETKSVMGFSNWEMGSHNTIEMRNMVVAHHQMTNRLETENIKAENMVVQTLNQVSNFETTTFTSLEDYERAQIKEEKEFDHLTIEQQSVRSQKKLHYFCERFKQFNPHNEQEPYIAPLGKETRDESAPTFDVREKVDEFISNSKKKTLLLLGGPGSGKSLFCKELAIDKEESYLNSPDIQGSSYIPIFIQLPSIDPSKLKSKLVEEGLRSYLGQEVFTHKQLDFLKHHQKLLFIFDSYDEAFPGKGMDFINLSVTNQLHEWEHAKFIFSCRSEDFFGRMKGQKGYFSLQNMPAVYEIHVQPFRPEDIKNYVNRYVCIQEKQEIDVETVNWKPETYFDYIFGEVQLKMKIRGLDELVKIPLNLKIAMNVLPKILDRYKQELDEFKLGQITARHLYEAFFEQRFERQEIKHIQQGKVGISPPEFYANCWAFSMQLAKEMGEESKLVYENSATLSNFRHRLVKFFSDQPLPEDGTTPEERKNKREQWIIARDGCPGRSIPKGGGKFEFAFEHETFKDFLIERLDNEQLESDPLLQALGQEGQINASYSSPVLPKPASASNTEKNTSDTVMSSANTRTLFNS